MGKYVKQRVNRIKSALAAEALDIGDIVCLNSAGKWAKAKADNANTYPAVGVVTAGVTTANLTKIPPEVCDSAIIAGAGTGLTVGAEVFLSATTAGAVTQTAPTSTGQAVQVLGTAVSATDIYYNIGSGQYRVN